MGLFTATVKRGYTDEKRKEDLIGNLKDIKWIDAGGDVLWSDREFVLDDEFFKSLPELDLPVGVRIPTLEEVETLFNIKIIGAGHDPELMGKHDEKSLEICDLKFDAYPQILLNGDTYYEYSFFITNEFYKYFTIRFGDGRPRGFVSGFNIRNHDDVRIRLVKEKKIDEGLFTSTIRRGYTDERRKEDWIGNLKDTKWIDTGDDVLWSDRDFRDDDEYFDIQEINDLKLPKWVRVAGLDDFKKLLISNDEVLPITFKNNEYIVKDVAFPARGYASTTSNKIYGEGKTSIYLFPDKRGIGFYKNTNNVCKTYTFIEDMNNRKFKIRLVRDRATNEGLFTSTIRRGYTDEKRKEDLVNFFGKGVKCKFYKIGNERLFTWKQVQEILKREKDWRLPTLEDLRPLAVPGPPHHTMSFEISENQDSYTLISEFGELKVEKLGHISSLNGQWSGCDTGFWVDGGQDEYTRYYLCTETPYAYIGSAGKIAGNQLVLIQKEVNEGLFTNTIRRGYTDEKRKEDQQVYLKYLKDIQWIDFGKDFNFLIADRPFKLGDDEKFSYDDAIDMFPKATGGKLNRIRMIDDEELNSFFYIKRKKVGDKLKIYNDENEIILPVGVTMFVSWAYCDGYIGKKPMCRLNVFTERTQPHIVTSAMTENQYILLVKDKGVNEGLFTNTIRRGYTDEKRKEDDVNALDLGGLYDWIQEHYEKTAFCHFWMKVNDHISVPVIKLVNGKTISLIYAPDSETQIYTYYNDISKIEVFKTLIGEFKISYERHGMEELMIVRPKDGEIDNRFFLKVIDTIIENTDNATIKKCGRI